MVNGRRLAAATVALTDGGYVLGELFTVDGDEVSAEMFHSGEVHTPLSSPSRPGDREASRLTGAVSDWDGSLEPTVIVSVHDDRGDGGVLVWHLGPLGAAPLVYDSTVAVSGVALGELVAYPPT